MPYHIARSSSCPSDKPYAVIKTGDGTVMGCHANVRSAGSQIGAIERSEKQQSNVIRIVKSDD